MPTYPLQALEGINTTDINASGTVTATTFVGLVVGAATNADNAKATQNATNATFYPTFVGSSSTGYQALQLGTNFTFNPSTTNLSITGTSSDYTAISLNAAASGIVRQKWYNSTATKFFTIGTSYAASAYGDHLSIGDDLNDFLTFTRVNPQTLVSGQGDATHPDIAWTTDRGTGLYQAAGSEIDFAVSGAKVATATASSWTLLGDVYTGTSTSSALRGVGDALLLNNAGAAAQQVFIAQGAATGSLSISGGTTYASSSDAGIIFYGTSHASKANKTEFYNNTVLSGVISAAGAWNLGSSVTATTFTGALAGNATSATTAATAANATNASNLAITLSSNNTNFCVALAPSASTSNQALSVGSGLTFNPSTNTLQTTTILAAGTVQMQAALRVSTQMTLSGSAGSAVFSQPDQGSSYRKVIVYLSGYTDTDTQIYTYPVAFSHAPYVYGVAAGVAGATASTTTVRFTTTAVTGFVILEGY